VDELIVQHDQDRDMGGSLLLSSFSLMEERRGKFRNRCEKAVVCGRTAQQHEGPCENSRHFVVKILPNCRRLSLRLSSKRFGLSAQGMRLPSAESSETLSMIMRPFEAFWLVSTGYAADFCLLRECADEGIQVREDVTKLMLVPSDHSVRP
jgi:hypothetical protein